MDVSVSGNSVTVKGNIKSVSDYQILKEKFEDLRQTHGTIFLNIEDSISITSSVIGYMTKLVQKEGIDLSIKVGNSSLYELFDDLNLVRLFKVKKA